MYKGILGVTLESSLKHSHKIKINQSTHFSKKHEPLSRIWFTISLSCKEYYIYESAS